MYTSKMDAKRILFQLEILSMYIGGFAVVHTKHRGKHDVNGVLTDTCVLTMHCSGVTGVQQLFLVRKRRHTCPWAVSGIAGQLLYTWMELSCNTGHSAWTRGAPFLCKKQTHFSNSRQPIEETRRVLYTPVCPAEPCSRSVVSNKHFPTMLTFYKNDCCDFVSFLSVIICRLSHVSVFDSAK